MANTKTVDVVNRRYELLKVFACVLLIQFLVLDNDVEEFSSLCKLHDQEQVLVSLYDLVELNNIRVMRLL